MIAHADDADEVAVVGRRQVPDAALTHYLRDNDDAVGAGASDYLLGSTGGVCGSPAWRDSP